MLVPMYVHFAGGSPQRGLTRLPYRMEWEDAFRDYLLRLKEQQPVVVCGDMNVAHKEIDLKNPRTNVKNAGFTLEERQKMTELLEARIETAEIHSQVLGSDHCPVLLELA